MIEHNKETFNLPRSLLPANAREGDVLALSITVDRRATDRQRQRIKALENELFK